MKNKIINFFKENFEEMYNDMKETDHNYDKDHLNLYHEEGDIWTHTKLVFDQYKGNNEITLLGILCHDLGKTLAIERNNETKRVSFLNHEALGIPLAYKVLKKYQETFNTITDEDLTNLLIMIKHHLRIFQVKNPKKIEAIYKAFSDDRYIYNFIDLAEADSRGRISDNGVKYMVNKKPLLNLIGTRKKLTTCSGQLNILIGMSGSGKSTYVESLGENKRTFSFDIERVKEYMKVSTIASNTDPKLLYSMAFDYCNKHKINVYQSTINQLIQCLRVEQRAFYDNTNLTTKTRGKLLNSLPKDVNPEKIALVFIPDKNKMYEINKTRFDKTIPINILKTQYDAFQFPDYNEFDTIKIVRLMGDS